MGTNFQTLTKVILKPREEIQKADYNPRKIGEGELKALRKSLKDFGWILPAYINDASDTLLSGHQRTRSFHEDYVPFMALTLTPNEEFQFNLELNKVTADIPVWIEDRVEFNLELPAGEEKFTPNYNNRYITEAELVPLSEINFKSFEDNIIRAMVNSVYAFIRKYGFIRPLVIDRFGNVISGGFWAIAAEKLGFPFAPVVVVDWDFEKCLQFFQFVNMQYGSFALDGVLEKARASQRFVQPARGTESEEGLGVVGASLNGFSVLWRYYHSTGGTADDFIKIPRIDVINGIAAKMPKGKDSKVLDFGCGHSEEADRFLKNGLDVCKFEPFFQGRNKNINRGKVRAMAKTLFKRLARGERFDVTVLNTVLNSVLLKEDRDRLVCLVSWMTSPDGEMLVSNRGQKDSSRVSNVKMGKTTKEAVFSGTSSDQKGLKAYDPETDTYVAIVNGSIRGTFFYTIEGMEADLLRYFHEVEWLNPLPGVKNPSSTTYMAVAKRPRYVEPEFFIDAMKWEFDLEYTETETLGLGDEAAEVARTMIEQTQEV